MLEKGAISKISHQEREFFSQIFLVGKKDYGNRAVINLKSLNKFVPYQHFKMNGLHYLKFLLQNGDYSCKIDLKDAYFSVPLRVPEISKISMGRKLVRVPFPLFWTRPSTKSFYNFTEGSNFSAKVFDDWGSNIPGRSTNFREYYGRDTRAMGLCNISVTAPRFRDKFQEVCFRTNWGSRVSRYDCELKDNDFVFTSGKDSENKESVSGGLERTRDSLVRTNTSARNINFHNSSYSPSTSSVLVSSTTTNSNTKEEFILHGHSDIKRYGQRETYMVDKKFRIKQRSGYYSASLTGTNASKIGCGAVCLRIRTGGPWSKKE